jgi:hypothetical protein
MKHESLVVLLSTGGSLLGGDSLASLDGASVKWVRVEREGESACLAARVLHDEPPEDFRGRVRRWGAARGWAVTVAPCHRPC